MNFIDDKWWSLSILIAIAALGIAFIWYFVIFLNHQSATTVHSTLNPDLWEQKALCSSWNSVYELDDDTAGCKLNECVRLSTRSGTDVDKCTCESNNKTVYRYCETRLLFYDYKGVRNESNLLSVNVG